MLFILEGNPKGPQVLFEAAQVCCFFFEVWDEQLNLLDRTVGKLN
jgi:hypothetical protein